MIGAALCAGAMWRRMLTPASAGLAVAAGAVAGLALGRLGDPALVAELVDPVLVGLGAVLVVPLAASIPADDRAGGMEALVAVRPLGSLSWAAGRAAGALLAGAVLVLLVVGTVRLVGGALPVPELLSGQRMDAGGSEPLWRFPLPAGRRGPFELAFTALPAAQAGATIPLEVQRGGRVLALEPVRVAGRTVRVLLPDLAPMRGDLYVRLGPGPLGDDTPTLAIGVVPLGSAGLRPARATAQALGLALLAAVAAACAFRFETACLAGLLALAGQASWHAPVHAATLVTVALLMLLFGALGTALVRRSALP